MAACPHCAADLGSAFVPKDEHLKRIKAKDDQVLALETEAAKGALVEGLTAELATVKATAAKQADGFDRFKALSVKGPKLAEARTAAAFDAIYSTEMTGRAEAERVPFSKWLDNDAPTHPALAHLFAATPAPQAQQAAPAPAPQAAQGDPAAPSAAGTQSAPAAQPRAGLPPANTGAAPAAAPTQGPPTPSQVAAIFASPEFRALPADQRRAKIAELQGQTNRKAGTVAV